MVLLLSCPQVLVRSQFAREKRQESSACVKSAKIAERIRLGHCVLATGTAQLLQHDTKGYPSSCCTSAHTLANVRWAMNLKQTAMAVDELS